MCNIESPITTRAIGTGQGWSGLGTETLSSFSGAQFLTIHRSSAAYSGAGELALAHEWLASWSVGEGEHRGLGGVSGSTCGVDSLMVWWCVVKHNKVASRRPERLS